MFFISVIFTLIIRKNRQYSHTSDFSPVILGPLGHLYDVYYQLILTYLAETVTVHAPDELSVLKFITTV